ASLWEASRSSATWRRRRHRTGTDPVSEVRGATRGTDQGKERGGRRFDVHVHDSGAQHAARSPPGLKFTGRAPRDHRESLGVRYRLRRLAMITIAPNR